MAANTGSRKVEGAEKDEAVAFCNLLKVSNIDHQYETVFRTGPTAYRVNFYRKTYTDGCAVPFVRISESFFVERRGDSWLNLTVQPEIN